MTKAEKVKELLGVKNREVFVVCEKDCIDPDFEAYFDDDILFVLDDSTGGREWRKANGEDWDKILMDESYEVIRADDWNYDARCEAVKEKRTKNE